ncbi:hypothetical protein ZIOFF_029560 [Zingiber officinale]|uniref:Ent-kaurenoic acid oxidase n=1 Tax=Zingiber officinale TaxID=94328 RepID=A0A8J5GRS1_ZINOF|nr:hypothetical protein ZIOFF_029560 [Zingiber officinale]
MVTMGEAWEFLLPLAALAAALWAAFGGVRGLHAWAWELRLGAVGRSQLPPGDMGWPFVGNMLAFLRAFKSSDPDDFVASFSRRSSLSLSLSSTYGGTGIYKAFMFGTPTIMVTTPELCKQVLMDDDHFVPGWPKATNELVGKKSFLGIIGEEHKRLRRLTSSTINGYETLSTYLPFIEKTTTLTLERWASKGSIEFLTELRRLTFRVVMKIFLCSEDEILIESLERVYTDLNYGIRAMAINIPGFAYHKAMKARRTLVTVLQNVLDERKAMRRANLASTKNDTMDKLMEVEDENGRKLSDEEIIDVLIMYLNAGHESSGHISMWATVFLQEHPDVFEKAKLEQEEIRRNMPPMQKGLTLKEIRKMEYLSKVIDETLRIINISFVAFRKATKDTYLNGYLIPKGWRIQLWYRNVNMDPQSYPEPYKFNSSRWDVRFCTKSRDFSSLRRRKQVVPGQRSCQDRDIGIPAPFPSRLSVSSSTLQFGLLNMLERLNPNCHVQYLPIPRPVDNCKAVVEEMLAKRYHCQRFVAVYTQEPLPGHPQFPIIRSKSKPADLPNRLFPLRRLGLTAIEISKEQVADSRSIPEHYRRKQLSGKPLMINSNQLGLRRGCDDQS